MNRAHSDLGANSGRVTYAERDPRTGAVTVETADDGPKRAVIVTRDGQTHAGERANLASAPGVVPPAPGSREERALMRDAVSFRTPALADSDVLRRDRDHFAEQPPNALAEASWGSREGVQHVKHDGELLTAGQAVSMLDHHLAEGWSPGR